MATKTCFQPPHGHSATNPKSASASGTHHEAALAALGPDDDDNNNPDDDDPGNSPSDDNLDENDLEDKPDFPDLDTKPMSSSRTKLHEPNTFDGTDPKKLHAFFIQCKLNFQDWPQAFRTNHAKVIFAQSYLKGMALEWFKPDLLGVEDPDNWPLWMDSWREFILELQTTFGPHDPVADTKSQLGHLHMKDIQGYRDGVLCHHFYSGLPDWIKDKEIDACYWECKEEIQQASKHQGSSSSNTKSSSSSNNNQPKNSQEKAKTGSNNNSRSSPKLASSKLGNNNSNSSKPKPSKLRKDGSSPWKNASIVS
ncbi:hypothetical protein M404DRAFT_21091 [Pisolithus tinctorius Marx 270]|uniref:DUF4939 domain-containing protein n=1 Tax=Pisolithus tinctorius Marx 270 TaxID=870435 RepID=A0A0C3KMT3_PISTI|nr:hypothetical protein M404DRAFT_21091 [Pisolithus tinctorius Marx 270]